ncbi:YtxH domain-containing protein (plasmid) [Rhizobium beringeri]|uniref:YtxH domain-containing protein n=1 Tax=Rhizobium beringeri TaxID=3019934 RepID=UPI002DDC97E5|nr:YtxH domain-containing protein [Rhizobium beringeri]WSG77350.1 YtxH domain-containing protein [Rhizobium beringeri]WSG92863.1 YtxH domain-containing protein [Rhizobium beringeri]WSH17545.1 YtxH domain-containing protein [Rhizobium beringeri]
METTVGRTSADLQQEIDQDRRRIGDRIDAIQERMSPGQLIDEILAYAKSSGGGKYVSNLGQALKENPLPVALMGVSLAWLMAKGTSSSNVSASSLTAAEYPLYPVNGPVRRLGPPEIENGMRYSHFADSSGKRLKALTDETGRRAGHFVDEAGKTYRGFADASGRQVDQISDEVGAMFDAATGWAAERWEQAKDAASAVAGSVSDRSSSAATSLQEQTTKLNQAILTQFRDQPLVGGALAFAVGAAIGAALPHTDTEDEFLGDAADSTKERLTAEALDVVDQSKEVASEVYEKAASVASDAHDAVKDRLITEVDAFKAGAQGNDRTPSN